MQVNDIVALFTSTGQLLVSLAAFLVAAVVAVTTARSGKADEQRTIRNQLTDTFNQMFATVIQLGQQKQAYGNSDFAQAQYVRNVLNQQYVTLLGQATFLANKIEKLVTAVEYNTLAAANADQGEFLLANKYGQRAIDVCDKDDLNLRVGAISGYAMILFMQFNFGDGDAKFQEAIDLLKNADMEKNYAHFSKGHLYMMWAIYEKQWAAPEDMADEHYKAAEAEFNAIEIPRFRERALQELNEAKKAVATSPLPKVGQLQEVQIQQSIFNQIHTPGSFQNS